MARFYLPASEWTAPSWELRGDEAHHAAKVLRLKQGDSCIVFDGCGRAAHAVVAETPRSSGVLLVPGEECSPSPAVAHLTLCQAVPKGANMDLIIQKAVELGAAGIVPVSTRNTVVKLEPKKEEAKRKRWQAIAQSAAKQSKRSLVPQVSGVMTLKEAFDYVESRGFCVRLIPYEHEEGMAGTKAELDALGPGQDIAVFIGPEGGFDEREIELALSKGVRPISLGRRILRTETAGLSVLSVLMMRLEGAL